MKIKINFQGGWENSFVEGSIDDFGQKRKYIGSGKSGFENYKDIKTTKNTVLGILYRLIGDQRKLIQIKNDLNSFFHGEEELVSFNESCNIDEETVYLRNANSDAFDKNGFSGAQQSEPTALFSNMFFSRIWGVFEYSIEEMIELIVSGKESNYTIPAMGRLEIGSILANKIDKNKKYNQDNVIKININEEKLNEALLRRTFLSKEDLDKGLSYKILVFCSIYSVVENILKEDPSFIRNLNSKGRIRGIAFRSFTPREFFLAVGAKKKIVGNPSVWKDWALGENNKKYKKTLSLKRKRGSLIIEIKVGPERAEEIINLIENAGVGSFVLGKKGLAYIDSIWR